MPVHIAPHACYDTIVCINIIIIIRYSSYVIVFAVFFSFFFFVYLRVIRAGFERKSLRSELYERLCYYGFAV